MTDHPEQGAEDEDIIVLTDEDGNEHEFTLIQVLQVDEKEYAVLLPMEAGEGDEDDDEDAAVILRIDADDQGEDILVEIEDEDEFQRVVDAWEEMLDEEDD